MTNSHLRRRRDSAVKSHEETAVQ